MSEVRVSMPAKQGHGTDPDWAHPTVLVEKDVLGNAFLES
jgi:hypothetical protein